MRQTAYVVEWWTNQLINDRLITALSWMVCTPGCALRIIAIGRDHGKIASTWRAEYCLPGVRFLYNVFLICFKFLMRKKLPSLFWLFCGQGNIVLKMSRSFNQTSFVAFRDNNTVKSVKTSLIHQKTSRKQANRNKNKPEETFRYFSRFEQFDS